MAHKKGGGSSKNGRDSAAQRLGVKRFGGNIVCAGTILVRQRGMKFHPGSFVGCGRDNTLYARSKGIVLFRERRGRQYVYIEPIELNEKPSHPKTSLAEKGQQKTNDTAVPSTAPA